jgi:hypothetical protein
MLGVKYCFYGKFQLTFPGAPKTFKPQRLSGLSSADAELTPSTIIIKVIYVKTIMNNK